jgi:hypothetical protein
MSSMSHRPAERTRKSPRMSVAVPNSNIRATNSDFRYMLAAYAGMQLCNYHGNFAIVLFTSHWTQFGAHIPVARFQHTSSHAMHAMLREYST